MSRYKCVPRCVLISVCSLPWVYTLYYSDAVMHPYLCLRLFLDACSRPYRILALDR